MLISGAIASSAYTTDDVVNAALELIFSNEGVYTSILPNDNGAVSLGRIGWHATRALTILKDIVNANQTQARTILGANLYNEILSATSWNNRIFTAEEKNVVSKLLDTPESKSVQDRYAFSDVKGYILHGESMGIKDGKVLVYFADLQNQMGSAGVERVAKAAINSVGDASKVTLQTIYDAAMADRVAKNSPSRRKKTYNYCNSLAFNSEGVTTSFRTGNYKITASSLNIRSGPGLNYSKVASAIPNGTTVTVTSISGDWGKVTYKGKTGWINLFYAAFVNTTVTPAITPDLNANGMVDASDARLTLRASAGIENLSESVKKKADVDSNGEITASDARVILRISAGLQ